jgi:superfamily I DNA/RNA helicase
MRGVLRELRVADASIHPPAAVARVSLAKNRMQTPESFLDDAGDDRDELIGRAWGRYEERLRRSNALDFDDLLLFTVRLLAEKKAVRDELRARWRYVLVDEYQDTNAPQYEILKRLSQEHRNLCVVGDDDQSIYGWRGADVRKILGFEKDFKGCKVVRLETNYRSSRQIIGAANAVIRNNPARHEKTLRSRSATASPCACRSCATRTLEAEQVAREIKARIARAQAEPAISRCCSALRSSRGRSRPSSARAGCRTCSSAHVVLRPQGSARRARVLEARGQPARRSVAAARDQLPAARSRQDEPRSSARIRGEARHFARRRVRPRRRDRGRCELDRRGRARLPQSDRDSS